MYKIKDVTDLDIAFGAKALTLMPKYSEIPEEFKNGNTKWNKFFNDCFFSGVKGLTLAPKDGIDPQKAFRHVKAIMGSFEPKHEHKEAACAYLMNEWFDDVEYTVG